MVSNELITAWEAVREKDRYIPFHSHNYYELVYYLDSQGVTLISGKQYTFTAGTFVLIAPGEEHDERHYAEGKLFCMGFTAPIKLRTHFFADTERVVEMLVKTIVRETLQQELDYKDMIEVKLMELLVVLKRILNTQSQKNQARSFEYVINYLAENSHEKIVLKDLAKQMNFSYDYFQHHFKELVGVSPQQFLIKKRLEMAQRLLKDGQLSCTEIAYRCGFSNSAQFSHIFKRETGRNPKNVLREK